MKRQRNNPVEQRRDAGLDSEKTNDLYDEILNQTTYNVQNSWFRNRSQLGKTEMECDTGVSEISLTDEIKSLNQQLIQVKRKLWPAAEACAQAWDSTPGDEFWCARSFANPMEALGETKKGGLNQMFINRSAIKLANVDAILDFGLSNSVSSHFLFADLCGAPGGFSEYIMKRIRSKRSGYICRGYGISLVGKNEHGNGAMWRLNDFCEGDDSFSIHYKVHYGSDGTGDLYNWENVKCFLEDIQDDLQKSMIPQQKMNLVVADGGFDAQRDSEYQEGVAQKLVLCELAAALELIGSGGTMVLKLFGCQTESMRMAMRSMYDLFDSMEFIKPVSSRPASSERYLVLSGFQGLPPGWEGGQSWINDVLFDRCLRKDVRFYAHVDAFLSRFDRDMLLLNLKACFAILSRLERKTAAKEMSNSTSSSSSTIAETVIREGCEPINIKMYKHSWQLYI